MGNRSTARARTAPSIRQSVTIPARLAVEVQRVAKRNHLTMSKALVVLAQRGLDAEAEARKRLDAAYKRFLSESDPKRKGETGKALIREIFGRGAIAEDPLR